MRKINNEIRIIAPAKLNLNLNVKKKDSDGLHFLESQVCFINLYDTIYLSEDNITSISQLTNKSNFIIKDETLLLKSLERFKIRFNWKKNFKVTFEKNIPIGAGLGGGSADAAAILLGLKILYNQENPNKKISQKEILDLGFSIGSDVPSCMYSKSLLISGKGEKISLSTTPNNFIYLIIYPGINLSTKAVFKSFEKFNNEPSLTGKYGNIKIHNSLLLNACRVEPQIKSVLDLLNSLENITAFGMTGSGSTCFGIFDNLSNLKKALHQANPKIKENWFIWFGRKKEFGFNRILY